MSIIGDFGKWLSAHANFDRSHGPLHDSLESVQREHAILQARMMGAQSYMGEIGWHRESLFLTGGKRKVLRDLVEGTTSPCMLIDPRPGLHIIDENDACESVSLADRRRVMGQRLFTVFPDNTGLPDAKGVCTLFESLCKTVREARAQAMNVHRFDVADRSGRFVERHWRTINTPILDDAGHVIYLLICPTPVTPDGLLKLPVSASPS